MSFEGKVVIVTGASSGIGAAAAIAFAKEGAQVCLVGRNKEKLDNVASNIEGPLVLIADVSKDEDAKKIINETIKHFGKLDVLVNNAGIIGGIASILQQGAIDIFDKVIATNLRAPVLLTNLAVPHLVKTKGNIVNVSSIAAVTVFRNSSFVYNCSKAALDHFTRSVALELAASGVRANTVNPGPVYTDIIENMGTNTDQANAFFENIKSITALNRVSVPEEVAVLILFLASEKAKAVTGSSYVTDNGTLVKTG